MVEQGPKTGIGGHLGSLHHEPDPFRSQVIFQHFLQIDIVVVAMHGNGLTTQHDLMAFAAKFIPQFQLMHDRQPPTLFLTR
jgi:hypothetical protein